MAASLSVVYVCRKCKRSKGLQAALALGTDAEVRLVGCQNVCQQPVAGCRVADRLEWFGQLDKKKRQRALVNFVNDGGPLPEALVKARSKKRAGKSPR